MLLGSRLGLDGEDGQLDRQQITIGRESNFYFLLVALEIDTLIVKNKKKIYESIFYQRTYLLRIVIIGGSIHLGINWIDWVYSITYRIGIRLGLLQTIDR